MKKVVKLVKHVAKYAQKLLRVNRDFMKHINSDIFFMRKKTVWMHIQH